MSDSKAATRGVLHYYSINMAHHPQGIQKIDVRRRRLEENCQDFLVRMVVKRRRRPLHQRKWLGNSVRLPQGARLLACSEVSRSAIFMYATPAEAPISGLVVPIKHGTKVSLHCVV